MNYSREKQILNLLDKLPDEIIEINIKPHLKPQTLVWLNKSLYIKYHKCIEQMIDNQPSERFPIGKYESYVRNIIHTDSSFVMDRLLSERFIWWNRVKNYYYKHKKYWTYIHFIFNLSIDKKASKCRKVINEYSKKHLGNNWYKNTKSIRYKWSN